MNSPAVTGVTTESAVDLLWWEWLSSYFDGQAHVVAGGSVVFPAVQLIFGEGELQNSPGVAITVLSETDRERQFLAETGDAGQPVKKLCYEARRFEFLVRAFVPSGAVSGVNAGNSAYLRRKVADLLRALLEDPSATLGLAEKGIRNLRVLDGSLLSDDVQSVERVVAGGDIEY